MARARYQRSPMTSGGSASRQGSDDPPADAQRGGEGQHRGDDRDRPLRQGPAHRPAEPVDVAAGAGQQVAGAGGLDGADREGERVLDEVLAELGQHQLAHHLRAVAGVAGQHRLRDQEDRQPDHDLVDVGHGSCRPRRPATRSPSRRGAASAESAASTWRPSAVHSRRGVSVRDLADVAAHGAAVGDRESGGHAHRAATSTSRTATTPRRVRRASLSQQVGVACRRRRPGRRRGTRPRRPRRAAAGSPW